MAGNTFGRAGVTSPTQGESGKFSSGGETITVSYHAKPGLGAIAFKNWILGILTLGIYRFWARTNTRRHVWSCIQINGEPLEYTGTGKELFMGALIVFFVIILPMVLITNGLSIMGYEALAGLAIILFAALFMFLIGMAIYRARRYRLSRTMWRGIRGTLTGSSASYSMLYFGSLILSSMTFGWSRPAMNLALQNRITNEMKFGSAPFRFGGGSGPLYARYAACWFGSIALALVLGGLAIWLFSSFGDSLSDAWKEIEKETLKGSNAATSETTIALFVLGFYGAILIAVVLYSIVWSFYTAREMAVFASYTAFENARFRLNVTTISLIWLWVGNILLIIFTLGIATPFAVQRMFRYIVSRLDVDGWVDFGKISQSTAKPDRYGEGLLDAFDLDGF